MITSNKGNLDLLKEAIAKAKSEILIGSASFRLLKEYLQELQLKNLY